MTLKTVNQRLLGGPMAQRRRITCDEEIHSQNVSMRSRYKKLYQNRQEYKSHIRELKGVGAETTVPIIQ